MTSAHAYIEHSDPTDPLDQVLLVYLQRIALELPKAQLVVRRLGAGRYEVDGRRLLMRLGIGRNFARDRPLVREEDIRSEKWPAAEEHDLLPYLRQAAHVSTSLKTSAISRIPKDLRVSFVEEDRPGAKLTLRDIRKGLIEDGNQRCESMRLACEQAQLREQAAAMYEMHGPIWRCISHNYPAHVH